MSQILNSQYILLRHKLHIIKLVINAAKSDLIKMTVEPQEKKISDIEKQLEQLENENKKLRTENEEIMQKHVKELEESILFAEEIIKTNDIVIDSAKKINTLLEDFGLTTAATGELALDASSMVGKFASSAKEAGNYAGKVLLSATEVAKAGVSVEDMGKQVEHTSGLMSLGLQQVSTASQQVSTGAQKLAELSQEAAKNTESLKKLMDETGIIAKDASSVTDEALKKSKCANEKGQQGLQAIENIKINFNKVSDAVMSMVNSVDQVGQMANSVSDIAGQTNMLALNAAIEAARAGEAGRGFAVVADAVKGLAGQSKVAAGSAINLVKGIKDAGTQTHAIATQSQTNTAEGTNVVLEAIKEAEGITHIMESMTSKVNNLTKGVDLGLNSLNTVSRAIEEVASIAEESSSASEEVSATVEEQTAGAQELTKIATQVATIAKNVEKLSENVVNDAKEASKISASMGNDAVVVEKKALEIKDAVEKTGNSLLDLTTEAKNISENTEKAVDGLKILIDKHKEAMANLLKKTGK